DLAKAFTTPRPGPHRGDDSLGRRHADVGGDQDLFERFDGVDIDRSSRLGSRSGIGPLYWFLEPAADLLSGSTEAVAKSIEQSHDSPLIPLRVDTFARPRQT